MGMKKLFLTMSTLLCVNTIIANSRCMDTSKHLSEKCDNKELHYVGYCQCDCDKEYTVQPHNQCLRCLHVHIHSKWEVIDHRPVQIREPYSTSKELQSPSDRDIKKVLNKLAINLKNQGS